MIKISKIGWVVLSLLLPLMIVILFSCSQDINGTIDLPYVQQIVVRGVLEAGQPVKGIMLTKTMPTLDTFSISQAELPDAVAYIVNNNKRYDLRYVGNALFDCDSLIAKSGETYSLTVKWNGKTAGATTTVPYPLNFDSVTTFPPNKRRHGTEWSVGLSAKVKINSDVVVVGGYYWIDTLGVNPYIKTYTSKAYRIQDTNSYGATRLIVYSKNVTDTNNVTYDSAQYKTSLFIDVYDPQFYIYFNSRLSGDSPNSSYGLSGSNIKWNVTGDGVGLLVGCASTRKRFLGF